jgi:hypothetical protein
MGDFLSVWGIGLSARFKSRNYSTAYIQTKRKIDGVGACVDFCAEAGKW